MLPEALICEIIPFPIDRQLFHIRQCARVLSVRTGAAADRFWKLECRRLYARLQAQRVDAITIRKELNSFGTAVQIEMQRASHAKYERGELEPLGGDAA